MLIKYNGYLFGIIAFYMLGCSAEESTSSRSNAGDDDVLAGSESNGGYASGGIVDMDITSDMISGSEMTGGTNICGSLSDGDIIEMGEISDCIYQDECVEVGTKQRIDMVCQEGQESSRTEEIPTSECNRNTNDIMINNGEYSSCDYETPCSTTGTKTRVNLICFGGVAIEREETITFPDCELNTDGVSCADGYACQAGLCERLCGNGTLEATEGEACDDGNFLTENCPYGEFACTVCNGDCQEVEGEVSYCGDGIINGDENCDDSNQTTETCAYQVEACEVCDLSCQLSAGMTSRCGDQRVDESNGEACDDGNEDPLDGCHECQYTCGNQLIEDNEECDDGNRLDGDGCNVLCQTEDGWTCNENQCVQSICGNEVVEGAEECDDGQNTGILGCLACRLVAMDNCDDITCNPEGTLQDLTESSLGLQRVGLLVADDGQASDYFGMGLSMDGDYVIIGANEADPNGDRSGAAYVFERHEGAWVQVIKLVPDDGRVTDDFGSTVSISGNIAVVGAQNHDLPNRDDSGVAYVYERVNGLWSQVAKLSAPSEFLRAGQHFGKSVSVDGDRLVIGAHNDTPVFFAGGAAYVFERQEGSWVFSQRLVPSDPSANALFGNKVSLNGSTIVIGTGFQSSAYIFNYSEDGQWIESRKMTEAGTFGFAVDTSGDWVAVGDYRNNLVYTYYQEDNQWLDGPVINPPEGGSGQYGYSVSLDEENLVVTAQYAQSYYGQGFLYTLNENSWEIGPNVVGEGTFQGYGHLIDISGETIMVSEIFNDTAASGAGAIIVYEPSGPSLCFIDGGCACIEPYSGALCDQL
jgi:cysteine-rich repeat protein